MYGRDVSCEGRKKPRARNEGREIFWEKYKAKSTAHGEERTRRTRDCGYSSLSLPRDVGRGHEEKDLHSQEALQHALPGPRLVIRRLREVFRTGAGA